jgi:uncharacterized protein (DUF697 family)
MNKKKLPRAIVPAAAEPSGAGPPLGATARETATAVYPAEMDETMGKSEAAMVMDDRRAFAEKLVERFSLWSGAAGLLPVPFVDLAAVGGVQILMLRRISQIYGVPFSANLGKALIASLAGSMIPASSGAGAASILKGVPVIGTAIGAIVMPVLSAGATYAIGMAFIQHFASGGTLLDFNPRNYSEFVKAQKEMWRTRPGTRPAAAKPPAD